MKTYTPRFFLLVALLILSTALKAQINFQVGYGLGFVNLAEIKHVSDLYKSQNPWLSSGFQEIKSLNTFIIGIRHGWKGVALGLNWKYRPAYMKAEGIEPVSNATYTKEIYLNIQSYSLGLEFGGERIHIGTSLDFNRLYIKEKHTGTSDKSLVSNENQWGSQFYLNLSFPASTYTQISLQPYYFMPWSDFSLSDLKNNLKIPAIPGSGKESLRHFGISLIISNGPQSGN